MNLGINLSRAIRTTAFRMSLIYLVLFGVSVFLLLSFIYWWTAGITTLQTDDTIDAEITGLSEQYRANGLAGLANIVRERSQNERQSLYLLIDPNRKSLAGNLNAWPEVETQEGGWLDFPYQRPVSGKVMTHEARGRHLLLGNGFQLLVGRDIHERMRIEKIMRRSLLWAVVLTLALGLIGGLFMSRNLLRRVEAINRTSRDIMAGDLHQRIPVTGGDDELDQLAVNLNEMLEQIERLVMGMRQVTENIAHDLRSPLNRLRSRLEVTLMGDASDVDYRDALQQTIDETADLLETFNALLNIAQAESGQLEADKKDFNLSALVRNMAELYEPVAEEKRMTLTSEVAPGITVFGNKHLMSQALSNLLDNAVKYSPSGGKLMLVLRLNENRPQLVIADSGAGIAEADRVRVLDRFVRLEASRNSPGSGLGLSLVKAVAQLHCADIELEDNLPGLRVVLTFEEQ
ncbi:MAG: HAMP domain-containing protein [Rhodospirillaceae bacterium]|jgi:signal transduction histidine kinase|nr:HAMP domain-containing protein [Rhodospirillaceae bacterium]MBT4589445.1 HAMP domain-containing protein [Rhodospirillaceae bacterium]MBT4938336.1 HAMP domain-containing protein [Rhodospirillaceae bacterium]MBT5941015.1 HAMP domain-containing protein [Rhodospirillaceae bacterium]